MKKSILFAFASSLLVAPIFAEEEILTEPITLSDVSFTQDHMTQKVTVKYKLSNGGDSALIFMDVQTNGVSIGRENVKTVSGDISKTLSDPIDDGDEFKTIVWDAHKDWPGHLATNVAVVLTAFYKDKLYNIPGVYMVVDISGGTSVDTFPVSYSLEGPDLSQDACRLTQLWLRRIEPGKFMMGSPADEGNRNANYEALHEVTLTSPFFAAVLEVTTAQHAKIMGGTDTSVKPKGSVSWETIRGSDANYPTQSNVPETSVMGVLRKKTNIAGFDLPTDAQWEYACRAGTTTAWNNGTTSIAGNTETDPNLLKLGWHAQDKINPASKGGLKEPNNWGLYDMHGNMMEICLDFMCRDNTKDCIDPKGYTVDKSENNKHIARGGSYLSGRSTASCRSAARDTGYTSTIAYPNIGYRIFCNLGDVVGK
jgi:formylglycine-generating enzyme required for sulfatase activity